jgi:hypothetical protein
MQDTAMKAGRAGDTLEERGRGIARPLPRRLRLTFTWSLGLARWKEIVDKIRLSG